MSGAHHPNSVVHPQSPPEDVAEDSPTQDEPVGATTCCKCPVCTCGPDCACPKAEKPGCDPCAAFAKDTITAMDAGAVENNLGAPPGSEDVLSKHRTSEETLNNPAERVGPRTLDDNDVSLPTSTPSPATPSHGNVLSTNEASGAATQSAPAPEAPEVATNPPASPAADQPLSPECQQALRMERRDQARNAKLAQSKRGDKSGGRQGRKRRWGTSRRGKGKNNAVDANHGAAKEASGPDKFDEWLGVRLKAWREGDRVPGGGSVLPPDGSGILEEIDFDPDQDEIGETSCLLGRPIRRLAREACDAGEATISELAAVGSCVAHGMCHPGCVCSGADRESPVLFCGGPVGPAVPVLDCCTWIVPGRFYASINQSY